MTPARLPAHPSLIVVIALAAALTLAGCDDEEDHAAGDGPGAAGTKATQDEPDGDTTPAEDESSTAALTGAACLPGNWVVDNEEFGELMSTVSGSAVDDVSGSVMVTFREDGTTTTHYDDWKHSITVQGATVTIVRDGEDSGTYQVADDGSMSLTDTQMSSTTKARMKMGGRTVDTVAPKTPSVFSQATFTCQGDELTVTADGGTTTLHREH